MILAVLIRIYFFIGVNWYDDGNYINTLETIMEGKFHKGLIHVLTIRPMINIPMYLSYSLFGISDYSATLPFFIFGILGILLIYKFASYLFGKKTGLLAALIMAFHPNHIISSSIIMPDTMIVFFTGLAILLFIKGKNEKKNNDFYYLFSGISVSFAWFAKVSGLIPFYFIIPYFGYTLIKKFINQKISPLMKEKENKLSKTEIVKQIIDIKWFLKQSKPIILVIAGFLIFFCLEGLVYQWWTGDFFERVKTINDWYKNLPPYMAELTYYPKIMFDLRNDGWNVPYGLFFYFTLLAGIHQLIIKDDKSKFLLSWIIIYFLYQQFGSQSITDFKPIVKEYRYLSILTIPSILLISRFLTTLKYKKFSVLLTLILLISSFYFASEKYYYQKGSMIDVKLTYDFLKALPEKKIYSQLDGATDRMNLYSGNTWRKRLRFIGRHSKCNQISDSYVLTYTTRGFNKPFSKIPNCFLNPPENWQLLKEIDSDFKESPYNRFNPKIYYVPPK